MLLVPRLSTLPPGSGFRTNASGQGASSAGVQPWGNRSSEPFFRDYIVSFSLTAFLPAPHFSNAFWFGGLALLLSFIGCSCRLHCPVTPFVTRAPPGSAGSGVPCSEGGGGCVPVSLSGSGSPPVLGRRVVRAPALGVGPVRDPAFGPCDLGGALKEFQFVSPGRRLRLTFALPVR